VTTSEPEPPSGAIPEQTINRNWTELIQELRSTQTGVQVLTGFLLAVPFTDQFHRLDHVERTAYLVVLTCAVGASMAVLAPIAWRTPPRHYGPWEQFASLLTQMRATPLGW